ncbi:MAG: crossover junction endodeoxyribonuclease RuvC [bacterium]
MPTQPVGKVAREPGRFDFVPGRVLGIDPGLGTTGYAVMDMRQSLGVGPIGHLIEAGVLRPKSASGNDLDERLMDLHLNIIDILEEYRPEFMAVERIHTHAKHPRTAILMAHARGVIVLAAQLRAVKVRGYAATQIKKTLTGSGRAPKEQMQQAVKIQLNLTEDPEPHDLADACAVAFCHLAHTRFDTITNSKRMN